MNKEKFISGLILVAIGSVILLDNLDIIDFYWRSVFRLWPVVLVVIGLNMLLPRRGVGKVFTVLVTLSAIAFLLFSGMEKPSDSWWFVGGNNKGGQKEIKKQEKEVFSREYTRPVHLANLTLKGGAVEYKLEEITSQLFEAETDGDRWSSYVIDEVDTGHNDVDIRFVMTNNEKRINLAGSENKVEIKLHQDPVWNVNVDFGAGTADLDFSSFKVQNFTIKGGAVSVEAKMGMPMEESIIEVEAGVASVEIKIPELAACQIISETGLSAKSFNRFEKQDDGTYRTPNFSAADRRYIIKLKGGLSSFVVNRY